MLRQRKSLTVEMQHFVDHPGDYIPMSKLTYKYDFTGNSWSIIDNGVAVCFWNITTLPTLRIYTS